MCGKKISLFIVVQVVCGAPYGCDTFNIGSYDVVKTSSRLCSEERVGHQNCYTIPLRQKDFLLILSILKIFWIFWLTLFSGTLLTLFSRQHFFFMATSKLS